MNNNNLDRWAVTMDGRTIATVDAINQYEAVLAVSQQLKINIMLITAHVIEEEETT